MRPVPHTPGPTAEAINYLIEKDVRGWGSETIGTDAGLAGGMDPPFPAHTLMHKANKYGLASLCNLDQLPPRGAILIAAPLKIEHGTGSPLRVLALVEWPGLFGKNLRQNKLLSRRSVGHANLLSSENSWRQRMAERSFAREVEKLRLGDGEKFSGEGILAITKALLECGVGYVGGYQGAPISHLMDVLADAQEILGELGVHFEASASEATATAMLAASVHYPIRGAATFKSTVGTNVASDALANLASGGVTGGALIIVGEDYGEGSSIMQERSHAFAMKSQVWLLDPRPNLPSIVKAVEDGFELSEASNTPVMLQVRIRCCHVHGHFTTKDNKRPPMTVADALSAPRRDTGRIVLPPASFLHEKEKMQQALAGRRRVHQVAQASTSSSAVRRQDRHRLQGGMYNGVIRALQRLGLADPLRRHRGAAVRAQRHLPADRRRVRRLLRRQGRGAGCRGRPARLCRTGLRRHAPQGRARQPGSPARTCCPWPANIPAR